MSVRPNENPALGETLIIFPHLSKHIVIFISIKLLPYKCIFVVSFCRVEWKEMTQVKKYDLGNEGEDQQSTSNQDFFLNPHKKADFFLNSELLKCPSKYSSRNCPHWHRSEKGN